MEFVLLSNKRTGSTFLQEALDSHPQVTALDEMFMVSTKITERRGYELFKTKKINESMNIRQYLEWISQQGDNTCFRLIYNQDQTWNVLPKIKDRNMKVIHLVRDPIDICVSLLCKFKHIQPEDTVKANPDEFVTMVIKQTALRDTYRDKLAKLSLPNYEMSYSNMFGKTEGEVENVKLVGSFNIRSNQKTYLNENINKNICEYLGIDNVPMYSNVTKKFTLPREQKIENWKQVEEGLINANIISNG